MVSGFTVSETGKPEKPGKNRKQKLHLTDVPLCSISAEGSEISERYQIVVSLRAIVTFQILHHRLQTRVLWLDV